MKTRNSLLVLSLSLLTSYALAAQSASLPLTPLHVSASGRYFETADQKPWFWLGDTAWSLLTAYTPQEQKTYLAARQKMGFTLVQVVAAWDGGTGTTHGLQPNPNTAGVQPWSDRNPLQPNEAYWKSVDAVVAQAARDHLYVGLLPAWGSFVVNFKMITAANAEAYGRWLGHRYRNAPNIVWIVDGDRAVAAAPEIWKAIAHGLQAGDAGVHPITLHPKGEGLRPSALFQAEPWLAANMLQTWASYTDIPTVIAIDYARTPVKPVILGEGAYEAGPEYPTRPITPLLVRKQAYWTYLSGAFFTYGHTDMWRKAPTWKASLESEGAKNMRVLRILFHGLPWWQLHPEQALFAAGEGSGKTYNVAAITQDASCAVLYLSSPSTVHLNLNLLKVPQVRVTWVDPRTGKRSRGKPVATTGTAEFSPPASWPDAILLLQPNQ